MNEVMPPCLMEKKINTAEFKDPKIIEKNDAEN